jgi:hypothetical protein
MRKGSLICLAIFLSLALSGRPVAFAQSLFYDCDCPRWTPSAEQIEAVESQLDGKPTAFAGLRRYNRYYTGYVLNGRKFIHGKFIPLGDADQPGFHIGEYKTPLQGEGCISNAVADSWDVYFNCVGPGAWTPSEQMIDVLEKKLGPVSYSSRYYAGITVDGHQIIVGVLLNLPNKKSQTDIVVRRYVVSAAELPETADGGCGVFNVTFDPSTHDLSSHCNGLG